MLIMLLMTDFAALIARGTGALSARHGRSTLMLKRRSLFERCVTLPNPVDTSSVAHNIPFDRQRFVSVLWLCHAQLPDIVEV